MTRQRSAWQLEYVQLREDLPIASFGLNVQLVGSNDSEGA